MKSEGLLDTMTSKLEKLVSTRTVVGEPVVVGDVTLVPIQTASFGFGSGGGEGGDKEGFGGGAGAGVSLRPIAIVSVKEGSVQLHSLIEPKSNLDRFAELIPLVVSKLGDFKGLAKKSKKEEGKDEQGEAEEQAKEGQ